MVDPGHSYIDDSSRLSRLELLTPLTDRLGEILEPDMGIWV